MARAASEANAVRRIGFILGYSCALRTKQKEEAGDDAGALPGLA
jgi:hypothetical protein